MSFTRSLKKNKSAVILLLLILGGMFYFTDDGVSIYAILGVGEPVEYLTYEDLSAEERSFLVSMISVIPTEHKEELIVGSSEYNVVLDFLTIPRDDGSGGYSLPGISGVVCSNTIPFKPYKGPNIENSLAGDPCNERWYISSFLTEDNSAYEGGSGLFEFALTAQYGYYTWGAEYDYMLSYQCGCGRILTNNLKYGWTLKRDSGIENCHYERQIDGWYTVYDIAASRSISCNPGELISSDLMIYECDESGDKIKKYAFSVKTSLPEKFEYKKSFTANVGVATKEELQTTVTLKNTEGSVIEMYSGTTPNIEVISPKALGHTTIIISTIYKGQEFEEVKNVYFEGSPVVFIGTARSYYQYNNEPITFYFEIKDDMGTTLTPARLDDEYISAKLSLTNGVMGAPSITHIGDGKYEIRANAVGTGTMIGTVEVKYLGVLLESESIQIEVNQQQLFLDVSQVDPVASLGDTETILFSVRDSLGNLFTPSAIEVRVTNPASTEVQTFHMTDLNNPSLGAYSLDYTFTEVEKYSFDIYVDTPGYERANIKASVGVSGAEDVGMAGPGWLFKAIWLGVAVIALPLILFVVSKVFRRGRR